MEKCPDCGNVKWTKIKCTYPGCPNCGKLVKYCASCLWSECYELEIKGVVGDDVRL